MLLFQIYLKNSEIKTTPNSNTFRDSCVLFSRTFLEIAGYLRPQDGPCQEAHFFALPSTTRANF